MMTARVAAMARRCATAAGAGLVVLVAWLPVPVGAYDANVHQQLTYHAARWLNRCVEDSDVPALMAIEARMIATSNMGLADSNAFVRLFRWSYFDPSGRGDRRWLWTVNTRFTDHFHSLVDSLEAAKRESVRYRELGHIVSYIQLVSEPSRAVPVYAGRFWRWSFRDRFERYPLSSLTLERASEQDCSAFDPPPQQFEDELKALAADTIAAVGAPMAGLPATWEAFWRLPKRPGDFGEYGPAGNSFGQRVEFPCGDRGRAQCVLLDDDPLYEEFAAGRHLAAIRATARAMWLMQMRYGIEGPPAVEPQ